MAPNYAPLGGTRSISNGNDVDPFWRVKMGTSICMEDQGHIFTFDLFLFFGGGGSQCHAGGSCVQ